jgi:tetratricopeptide (TPR) repeat protein
MSKLAIINDAEITAGLTLADSLRREGRFAEARRVLAREVLSLDPEDFEGRLTCEVEHAKVERSEGNLGLALRTLREASPLAGGCRSDERLAKYHHGLAVTYQLLGDTDEALLEYAAASRHWEGRGDFFEAGCTENNVALIQLSLGRLEDAREHVDRARGYFVDLPVKSAEVDETEAQLLLAEGKPFEALRLVNRAVEVFFAYGETELVKQSLPTLIKASADYQCEASAGR